MADRVAYPGETVLLGWPGFGPVPPDPGVRSLDDLYRLVRERIDGPVDLVAQSMGGVLAMRAALEFPQHVRRLVLAATSGGLDLRRFGAADWRDDNRRDQPHTPEWFRADRTDLTARLGEVRAPVLLVWGDADPISPVAVGRYLESVLPVARLLIVPGGDHALARDRAADIASAIRDHLLGAVTADTGRGPRGR